MISNCGHDENGRYRGGRAGDQSLTEWYIRTWYNYPWDCVLRYNGSNASEVRRYIGNWAIRSAKNNHIGYNQDARYGFWQHLVTSDYDPAQITINCDTDCSAGVLAICKAVGYKLGIQALKNIDHTGYTGNMREILSKAGFTILTDYKYRSSEDYLEFGDILLNIKSHTCTYVGNGQERGEDAPTQFVYGRESFKAYESGLSCKEIQACLSVIPDPNGVPYYPVEWGIDGKYGGGTYNSICKFQSDYNLGADGNVSKGGWTWQTIDRIIDALGVHPYIEKGMTGKSVYQIQWKLNHLGFTDANGNKLEQDGIYGQHTFEAICKLQNKYGFGADGKCFPNGYTWNKIDELLG